MRHTVPISPAIGFEVWRQATRYKLSPDDFIRTSLQFASVMLPGVPGEGTADEKGSAANSVVEPEGDDTKPANEPDLLQDFCRAVLPTFGVRHEFRRVSAMCDDAVLKLRSRRLEIEAFIGKSPPSLGVRHPLYDPMLFVETKEQHLSADTLTLLEQQGPVWGYFHLYPVGCEPLDLVLADTRQVPPLRIDVQHGDYIRWFPTLRHYCFVPPTFGFGAETTESLVVDEVLEAGFLRMLATLVEGTCLLLQMDPGLPAENLRLDLMLVHIRARKLAAVWRDDLLRAETSLHQLGAARELVTEKVLIIASGAGPSECVFGPDEADEPVAETQEGPLADKARFVSAGSLEAFDRHGD